MKDILAKIAIISTLALIASCKKEAAPDPTPGGTKFNCTIEHVAFKGTSRIPEWQKSDAIGVYSPLDTNVRCEVKDAATGAFDDSPVKGTANFLAVYPYSDNNVIKDSVLFASVPAVQQLVNGKPYAPDAIVSVAKSATKDLAFRNCMALFKLTIPRDDIKKVEIYTYSREDKLAGAFTVDMTKASIAVNIVPEMCDTVITLVPSAAAFTPGSYYASFLPGTHNGFKIRFTNLNDETVVISRKDTVNVAVNAGEDLGNFFYYEISTAEELAQWAKESEVKSTPWDVVTIMSNINMTGVEYVEAEKFSGVFTAKKDRTSNYRISGLTKPVFNKFYGKCDGVDLESNIVYDGSWGSDYGCGLFSHYIYIEKRADAAVSNVNTYGTIECKFSAPLAHQFNLGGICGATNGVPMSNCTNNADIIFTNLELTDNYATIGGIAGAAQTAPTASFTDCTNNGTITIRNTKEIGKTLAVGGIAGYVTNITVTNAVNKGAIIMTPESKQKGNRILGGIIGQSSTDLTIINSNNDAPITLTPGSGDTGTSSAAAGILGYASKANTNVKIEGCTNTVNGVILMSGASSYSCPGGIVGWSASNMDITGCTNNANITFRGSSASDLRMGGILGNCANASSGTKSVIGSASAGCSNTGIILNEGGAAKNAYIGGILGCSGSKTTDLTNCRNTGDVITNATAAMSTALCMGGITGYSGTALCTYEDCTSKCSLSVKDSQAHKTICAGVVHGYANTDINAQHNGLGGNVLGEDVTAENFLTKYYGKLGSKKTYSIDADESKPQSYFIQ